MNLDKKKPKTDEKRSVKTELNDKKMSFTEREWLKYKKSVGKSENVR